MNYYDTVKEKIADYIVKDEVVETEEVISAYTLISALENCNKKLRHSKEKGKCLLDKLNGIYPKDVIKKKGKLFKTKENHFEDYALNMNINSSEIVLYERLHGVISICKDFNYSDIYSSLSSITEDAYNECSDDLKDILLDLEYFGKLFIEDKKTVTPKNTKGEYVWFMDIDKYYLLNNKISCGGFDIEIEFNKFAKEFTYSINLNKDLDPNGNSNRIYYNQDNNLHQIMEENKEAILKNTPIKLKDLSYMFFMIVLEYRDKLEKENTKKEIQKIMSEVKMNED